MDSQGTLNSPMLSPAADKLLFTPGPLTTSQSVKQAMLRDLGSRDFAFISIIQQIRTRLMDLAHISEPDHVCILMQGSGTFGIESVISSVVPDAGKILFLVNGEYGKRMVSMAQIWNLNNSVVEFLENQITDAQSVEKKLQNDPDVTHLAMVHCETTTGIINPIESIGKLCNQYKKTFIVDAMSSFGGIQINMNDNHIDFLISSSNKCIEGVPGFSFVLANTQKLRQSQKIQRSLSLNLYEQWTGLQKSGQFRFTPPTHTLLAFHQALIELDQEGGVEARALRYKENNRILVQGMEKMGFEPYIKEELRGHIITSFLWPNHPNFSFTQFYEILNQKGFVIYPGKLSQVDTFRIGNIGRIFVSDIENLLLNIEKISKF